MVEILVFVLSMFVAIFLGIPIAYSLVVGGMALMFYLGMLDYQVVASNIIQGANTFPLMAIPFFVLAGEIMNRGGITTRIIKFVNVMLGRVKGGSGYVNIGVSVVFAGLSGSPIADVSATGPIVIPMMNQAGIKPETSVGLSAASAIVGAIIPPSITMILYGVLANVSITGLFMAGIIPGVIIALGLSITWWIMMRKYPVHVSIEKVPLKEKQIATKEASWALFLPVIIIVGLRGGIFSPTEAGGIAVFYAMLVGFFVYRELSLSLFFKCLRDAAKTSAVVMFLVSTAMLSAWLIAYANLPRQLRVFIEPLIDKPLVLLFTIVLFILVIGMVMDIVPVVLILTPIFTPIVNAAGIDLIYFGVLLVITALVGTLTPPVGGVLNVAALVGKIPIERVVVGMMPFLITIIIVLCLFVLFPQLITVPMGWIM